MSLLNDNLLTLIVFTPLLGALLLYVLPGCRPEGDRHGESVRFVALIATLVTFVLSALLLAVFDTSSGEMQFVTTKVWVSSIGASYKLGVDGISLFLVMLTTLLMVLVMIASTSIHQRVRGYLASMLILETAILGTLFALDALLFYFFWELMLAPMYFIIGIWGGKRRIYATLKFVLYTVVGSVLMLVAILFVVWRFYDQHHVVTFLISQLIEGTTLSRSEEIWLFAAFALAFGIKVPIFPFHTWLPDAHVEAPTGGSVILAGVLLKMGLYGFIRLAYPLFPRAAEMFAPYLAVLAVIGVVYGSLVAWAQSDIKKLVAYSSVAHLGYCVLGLAAFNVMATSGALYQMLNHGVSTGALFLLVGVLYDRKHTRAIADYGGLAQKVPCFAALFLIFTLSSIAVPLTNGFVGEFLILSGAFAGYPQLTTVALLGVVLGAVYMLSLYKRTVFGDFDEKKNGDLTDLTSRERYTLFPLVALVFVMGIFPGPFLSTMRPSVETFLAKVESVRKVRTLADTEAPIGHVGTSADAAALPVVWRSGLGSVSPNQFYRGE